jgi:hypothetical protein
VLKVDLLGSLDHIIHVSSTMVGSNVSFKDSFVYGNNFPSKQEALWAEIINHGIDLETIPWILLGDFNVIRSMDEKRGGTTSWSRWQNNLNNCVI